MRPLGLGPLALCLALMSCGDVRDRAAGSDGRADGPEESGDPASPQTGEGEGEGEGEAAPPGWCQSNVSYMYDPPGRELETFPDDFYTVDDDDSATGLEVFIDPGHGWLETVPRGFDNVYTDLSGLDGWGPSAGVVLRFTGPVTPPPSGAEASVTNDQVLLLDLEGDTPERVPYESVHTDEGATLVLWPLRPLRPGARHAAVVTRSFPTHDDGCVRPSERLKGLLTGDATGDEWTRLTPRYAELLDKTGLAAYDIGAAVVFTTQTTTDEGEAIAAWIRDQDTGWSDAFDCSDEEGHVRCVGALPGHDFRRGGVVQGSEPVAEWEVPATFWLPADVEGPAPLLIMGHGLGGDRSQGSFIADLAAARGIGVVAIDAPFHGEHPSAAGGQGMMALMDFFGVDMFSMTVHGLKLRDSFRQATFDKLELLRAMEVDADIDGDGDDDVDLDRIGYLGVSLGGIMGPELLALTDRVRAAALVVAGGRLSTVVRDGSSFGPMIEMVVPPDTTQGDLDRFFPVMQSLVERGDPVNYAPHVLGDRLDGVRGGVPSVLMQVAMGDDTVPNTASHALARAFGVDHLEPVIQSVGLLDEVEGPLRGNRGAGGATAGLSQFDRVTVERDGPLVQANHSNVLGSAEGFTQLMGFFDSWLDEDAPIIAQPYEGRAR